MPDLKFLNLILSHTLKCIDKCSGEARETMIAQAERLKKEIEENTPKKIKPKRK